MGARQARSLRCRLRTLTSGVRGRMPRAMTTATATALVSHRDAPTDSPRYADLDGWRAYQPYFPEEMRCTPARTPTEERWAWRGLSIHLDRMAAPASPVKVVVLHGAGAYGRVMAPAAVLAHRHGFETVAPDLPGYGLTHVPRKRFDYPLWVDCVADLVDAEFARDGRPVVLFGVSLGGLLAYQAAARVTSRGRGSQVIGLVATTLADPRERAVRQGFARTKLLGSAGLWLLERTRFLTDGLPLPMRFVSKMDRISNDPDLARVCERDPLGGGNWVPARFLRSLMHTPPDIEPEDFRSCPVLLAHPGVDRMTDIALSRRFFDRLAAPKRMVVLEGASHMPTERPGIDQLASSVLAFVQDLAPGSDRS